MSPNSNKENRIRPTDLRIYYGISWLYKAKRLVKLREETKEEVSLISQRKEKKRQASKQANTQHKETRNTQAPPPAVVCMGLQTVTSVHLELQLSLKDHN